MRLLGNKGLSATSGMTLLELVVSVAIIAILASMGVATYTELQYEAKVKTSLSNAIQIEQAFINHFYNSVMDYEAKEFPPEPLDNKMTQDWADGVVLYNGRSVSDLFSGGRILYNSFGNPFLYERLTATNIEEDGFKIEDPDIGFIREYRP